MPEIDPDRKPIVYSYRRCSHPDSRDSGLGMDAQAKRMEAYVALLKAGQPNLVDGEGFDDPAISASKHPFIRRPAGRRLDRLLKPGDHIVFARIDRGFRGMYDLVNTIRRWEKRKINIHFVEEGLDLTTPFGRAMMHIIGAIAQLHSEYTSERNKESAARMRELGRPTGGPPPPGFKWAGKRGDRHLVPAKNERAVMQEIVRLHDIEGMGFRTISENIRGRLREFFGLKPLQPLPPTRSWGHTACAAAYAAELELGKAEARRLAGGNGRDNA